VARARNAASVVTRRCPWPGRWTVAGVRQDLTTDPSFWRKLGPTASRSDSYYLLLRSQRWPFIRLDYFLASAHLDKRVRLTKLPKGEPVFTFELALPPIPFFPRVIERVAFDGTGGRLAVDYADGDIRIWDSFRSGQVL